MLKYSCYNTSALSGVTISTSISDAGYNAEDGNLQIDEGSENAFLVSGLIDTSDSIQLDNFNNPDPLADSGNLEELLLDSYDKPEENHSDYSIIDEMDEIDILVSLDIV